jgi:hypothetical protein
MEEISDFFGFQIREAINNGKITNNGRDGRDKNEKLADTRKIIIHIFIASNKYKKDYRQSTYEAFQLVPDYYMRKEKTFR